MFVLSALMSSESICGIVLSSLSLFVLFLSFFCFSVVGIDIRVIVNDALSVPLRRLFHLVVINLSNDFSENETALNNNKTQKYPDITLAEHEHEWSSNARRIVTTGHSQQLRSATAQS